MRKLFLTAASIGLSLLLGAAPAAATDQSAAVQLCAKNPQCGLIRGQGGVNLGIDHPGGGTSEVWCPDQGPCVCQTCTGGGGGGIARTLPWTGRNLGYVIRAPQWGVKSLSEPVSTAGPAQAPKPVPPKPPVD